MEDWSSALRTLPDWSPRSWSTASRGCRSSVGPSRSTRHAEARQCTLSWSRNWSKMCEKTQVNFWSAHQRYLNGCDIFTHSPLNGCECDEKTINKKMKFHPWINMIIICDIIVRDILSTKGNTICHAPEWNFMWIGECGSTRGRPLASTSDSLACQSSPWITKEWNTSWVLLQCQNNEEPRKWRFWFDWLTVRWPARWHLAVIRYWADRDSVSDDAPEGKCSGPL